jgi:hypothetical protein
VLPSVVALELPAADRRVEAAVRYKDFAAVLAAKAVAGVVGVPQVQGMVVPPQYFVFAVVGLDPSVVFAHTAYDESYCEALVE